MQKYSAGLGVATPSLDINYCHNRILPCPTLPLSFHFTPSSSSHSASTLSLFLPPLLSSLWPTSIFRQFRFRRKCQQHGYRCDSNSRTIPVTILQVATQSTDTSLSPENFRFNFLDVYSISNKFCRLGRLQVVSQNECLARTWDTRVYRLEVFITLITNCWRYTRKRPTSSLKLVHLREISDFRCGVVAAFALLWCCAPSVDRWLPTFRYDISFPSSRVNGQKSTRVLGQDPWRCEWYTVPTTKLWLATSQNSKNPSSCQ